MTRKFDPKRHQGKTRIYAPVPGTTNISRLYAWDPARDEYRPPAEAKSYLARRWEIDDGKRIRRSRYFDSLAEARHWLQSGNTAAPISDETPDLGPHLRTVVEEWRQTRFPSLARGTQVAYEKLLRLHFGSLLTKGVRAITPQVVDQWIVSLIANRETHGKVAQRKNFKHELRLLVLLLNYYREYHDDPAFVMPVKKRHRQAILLRNRMEQVPPKDMSEAEFGAFLEKLRTQRHGASMAVMATLQFYQALRVSEAAALHWEDVRFDWSNPRHSRLTFCRHVCWIRGSRQKSYIDSGFKNSRALGGVKEHPMLPPVFHALASLHQPNAAGLVFRNAEGDFFAYRQIQSSYNRAFEAAGLPYRSTHVMRHAGTRKTYDETGGDLEIAKQHLGNSELSSVLVYAQRSAQALTQYAQSQWDVSESEGGRKWSQKSSRLKLVEESQDDRG